MLKGRGYDLLSATKEGTATRSVSRTGTPWMEELEMHGIRPVHIFKDSVIYTGLDLDSIEDSDKNIR